VVAAAYTLLAQKSAKTGLIDRNSPPIGLWRSWPAACITVSAISISQLVLNEIAWSPGDPGTGAPSIFWIRSDVFLRHA
jgi:hypothetical protein